MKASENILYFPVTRAIGGARRQFDQHRTPAAEHETHFQQALQEAIQKSCEAGMAMHSASKTYHGREDHVQRGLAAAKAALFAALSAAGCSNADRPLHAALVAQIQAEG